MHSCVRCFVPIWMMGNGRLTKTKISAENVCNTNLSDFGRRNAWGWAKTEKSHHKNKLRKTVWTSSVGLWNTQWLHLTGTRHRRDNIWLRLRTARRRYGTFEKWLLYYWGTCMKYLGLPGYEERRCEGLKISHICGHGWQRIHVARWGSNGFSKLWSELMNMKNL